MLVEIAHLQTGVSQVIVDKAGCTLNILQALIAGQAVTEGMRTSCPASSTISPVLSLDELIHALPFSLLKLDRDQ
jgi:hypothetical protein